MVGNISATERTTYDYTPLDSSSHRMGTMEDLERTVRDTKQEAFNNTLPHYVGKGYGLEDFGNSQYDKDYIISMADLENRSLYEIREERKEAEIKSIVSNVLAVILVFGIIAVLFNTSKNSN